MNVVKQTLSDKFWTDEKGNSIPVNRLTKVEKLRESKTFSLLKKAKSLSGTIADFKDELRKVCQDVYEKEMIALDADPTNPPKGNFTFYNFNHEIRVKVNINEPLKYSDAAILAAKQHFDNYMETEVITKEEFMKEAINNAFSAKNGQIDVKRIADLLSFKSKTKSQHYVKACECLEQGSTREKGKTYFQIAVKNEKGDYDTVELNFSKL